MITKLASGLFWRLALLTAGISRYGSGLIVVLTLMTDASPWALPVTREGHWAALQGCSA